MDRRKKETKIQSAKQRMRLAKVENKLNKRRDGQEKERNEDTISQTKNEIGKGRELVSHYKRKDRRYQVSHSHFWNQMIPIERLQPSVLKVGWISLHR